MDQRTLIRIDRAFKPIYNFMKWVKKLSPTKNKKVEQFIVLKFFGLGSISRISYVLDQIDLPKDKVIFISLLKNKDIFTLLNIEAVYIDSLNLFTLISSTIKVIRKVWLKKGVKILDMERSANLSGIFRIIISIRKPCSSFYFKTHNSTKGNQNFITLNEKPALNAIVEMFDSAFYNKTHHIKKSNIDSHQVIININSGSYIPQRMFPSKYYSKLVYKLVSFYPNFEFVLTGSESEKNRVNEFEDTILNMGVNQNQITNLAGKQSLNQLIGAIKSAKFIITNDSGPLHFAQLSCTPTIAIWGPTSPKLVGYPNSNIMLNLTTNEQCSPCFIHPKSDVAKACKGELTCFKNMNIDDMVSQITTFISIKKASLQEK